MSNYGKLCMQIFCVYKKLLAYWNRATKQTKLVAFFISQELDKKNISLSVSNYYGILFTSALIMIYQYEIMVSQTNKKEATER